MPPDPEVLVSVENVSKKFCRSLKRSLWYGVADVASSLNPFGRQAIGNRRQETGDRRQEGDPSDSIISALTPAHCPLSPDSYLPPLRADEFWAVQNVSFEIKRGECLGLIGHNGAGKSTLLKVLNGLIPPDTGRITMKGRVAALIELNAGFNPILSGRENIFSEAALLGFSKQETLDKFDAIVDFAEIGDFLDMPVQNYSSGMRVRLGFAVAAQMEPDVLIIDEVLAVGDVGFRYKCLNRIAELLRSSACIFVSHAMPQVARICTKVIHLNHGKCILATDDVPHALQSYYDLFEDGSQSLSGDGQVEVLSAVVQNASDAAGVAVVGYGEGLDVIVECKFKPNCETATIQLVVWNQEMLPVIDVLDRGIRRFPITPDGDRLATVHAMLPKMSLNDGRFSLSVIVLSPDGKTLHCRLDHAIQFLMRSNAGSACHITMEADWEILEPGRVPRELPSGMSL